MTRVAVALKSDLPKKVTRNLNEFLDPRLEAPPGDGVIVRQYGDVVSLSIGVRAVEDFPAATPILTTSLDALGFADAPVYPALGYAGAMFYILDNPRTADGLKAGAYTRGSWTWITP